MLLSQLGLDVALGLLLVFDEVRQLAAEPTLFGGRPVLVEFWRFTCINWMRTLPYVRSWFEKYRRDGLVVLGAHTPEFDVERRVENIRRAAQELSIDYPIAIDIDYRIWRAFGNRYWPALYFADASGQIRHHHFSEGDYERSELILRQLLAAAGAAVGRALAYVDPIGAEAAADWNSLESQETYLGFERAENFASPGGLVPNGSRSYENPESLTLNDWALAGQWTFERQAAVLNGPSGRIVYRFHARDVHLVMGPAPDDRPVRLGVLLDGEPPGAVHGIDTDERGGGAARHRGCIS